MKRGEHVDLIKAHAWGKAPKKKLGEKGLLSNKETDRGLETRGGEFFSQGWPPQRTYLV